MSIVSELAPKARDERDYFSLDEIYEMGWNDLKSKMEEMDVVPVVHAKLLNPHPYGLCSHCYYLIDIRDEFNYCPKCGAMLKTDEVKE